MADQEIKEIVPYTFDDIYNDIASNFTAQGYDTAPGSNISQLVTSMAYAISMLNANTAMNVNEMILSYANRRENVLASARNLAYEAKHKVSYVYNLTLKSKTGIFIIPKYTVFEQNGTEYVYTGKQLEIYGTPEDTLRINVKEGHIYQYTDSETLHVFIGKVQDSAGNIVPQYYIDIPFINIEDEGIEVLCTYVDEYGVLHEKEQWEQAPSLHIEVDQEVDVRQFFRIDNIEYGTPRIYFRYSGIGKELQPGTEVFINVLESHGSKGEMDLKQASSITCPNEDIYVISADLISAGSDEEDASDIKVNAPKLHNSSNRLVVANDYIAACKRDQRVKNCIVWGGEDEFPKAPGHIWFSFLPPGTHQFSHNDSYTTWTRDNVSFTWDYTILDKTEQETARSDYYRLNYIPDESIKSPYRNDDGTVAMPGIWDRLDTLKIPTLVYHNRAPIYCTFDYEIEVAKYLAYDSKSSMHTDMFNIIDACFSGIGDELQYENFDVEYFNSNIIKRVDERATDLSGFNMSLTTKLVLNERCLAMENPEPNYRDIYIPLAVPFEKYFDAGGHLLIDRLPSIDTNDFVSYTDDGIKGRIYTDWSAVRDDIENKKRQQHHKIIYAPIMVKWRYEYSFKDRTDINTFLMPFEMQPDDYLQTGEPDAQYTFNKTKLTHMKWDDILNDYDRVELVYGTDWYWDADEPEQIRLSPLVEPGEDDALMVEAEAQAGWYYLFNSFRKEILIHLFVDGTKSGFHISLAGDWSQDPEANTKENYLYSYDSNYLHSEDDDYLYTRAIEYGDYDPDFKVESMGDNYTQGEANLSSSDSYIDTTSTQPRAFLTTLDGGILTSVDHWFLTTNGYIITDETERNSYTGPIVREINKYMYLRSPLKYDLFYRNRYLNLRYLSSSFALIRNVIPLLNKVEFYSLADDGVSAGTNYVDITLELQGGESSQSLVIQARRGITWEQLEMQIKDPTKLYCDFRWWSLEAYGDEIAPDQRFSTDSTLYAVWKTQTYDLTFDGNGGTITPDKMSVKAGTKWGVVEDAVVAKRQDYIMDGFSTTADGERISRYDTILAPATVFVRWASHKMITITFESSGGSTQPDLEILSGYTWRQIKNQTQVPTKDGWLFDGWYLDNALKKKVSDDTVIVDSCTLYAKWIERLVVITFGMNGGKPEVGTINVSKGTKWLVAKQKITANPSIDGSLFLGWSLKNDIENRELLSNDFVFDEYEYTVYALFTTHVCRLRFFMNGGTPTQESFLIERGSKWKDVKGQISDPTRKDYSFDGWAISLGGSVLDDNFIFDTNEITLYASWSYAGVVINFNSQGGTTVSSMKVSPGTTWLDIRYNIKEPTRSYYKFTCWSLKANDATPIADSQSFTDSQYTLYAQWQYNGVDIQFDEQGGSAVRDLKVVKGTTWAAVKSKVDPTEKVDYKFKWWSTDQDGAAIKDSYVFNEDIEPLWAVWGSAVVRVAFDAVGGTPTPDPLDVESGTTWADIKSRVSNPTRSYYKFSYWSLNPDDPTPVHDSYQFTDSQTTLYAHWVYNGVDIQFDEQGGSSVKDLKVVKGTTWAGIKGNVSNPTKSYYKFLCWSLEADDPTPVQDSYQFTDSRYTLYAQWQYNSVDIHFDEQGGSAVKDLKVVKGTTWSAVKSKVSNPTRSYYKFLCWSLDADGSTPVQDSYQFTDSQYTLYAQWQYNGVDIQFDEQGGSPVRDLKVVKGTTWAAIKDSVDPTERKDYKFKWWSTSQDGAAIKGSYVFNNDKITLYASWSYAGAVINFNSQGGTTVNPMKVSSGTTWRDIKGKVSNPTKSYYKFLCWSLKPNDPTPIQDSYQFTNSQYTLYAYWAYNGVDIQFDEQGGSPVKDLKVVKGTTWAAVKDLVDPTEKADYKFKWWSTSQDGAAIKDSYVFNNDTERLWAVWEPTVVRVTFDADGGSPTPAPLNVAKGTTWADIKSRVQNPTKSGKTFKGWAVKD